MPFFGKKRRQKSDEAPKSAIADRVAQFEDNATAGSAHDRSKSTPSTPVPGTPQIGVLQVSSLPETRQSTLSVWQRVKKKGTQLRLSMQHEGGRDEAQAATLQSTEPSSERRRSTFRDEESRPANFGRAASELDPMGALVQCELEQRLEYMEGGASMLKKTRWFTSRVMEETRKFAQTLEDLSRQQEQVLDEVPSSQRAAQFFDSAAAVTRSTRTFAEALLRAVPEQQVSMAVRHAAATCDDVRGECKALSQQAQSLRMQVSSEMERVLKKRAAASKHQRRLQRALEDLDRVAQQRRSRLRNRVTVQESGSRRLKPGELRVQVDVDVGAADTAYSDKDELEQAARQRDNALSRTEEFQQSLGRYEAARKVYYEQNLTAMCQEARVSQGKITESMLPLVTLQRGLLRSLATALPTQLQGMDALIANYNDDEDAVQRQARDLSLRPSTKLNAVPLDFDLGFSVDDLAQMDAESLKKRAVPSAAAGALEGRVTLQQVISGDDVVLLAHFERFLRDTYCHENLQFYRATEEYRRIPSSNRAQREVQAVNLYRNFIATTDQGSREADKLVNLDGSTFDNIRKRLSDAPPDLYDGAGEVVWRLMETDSLPRFLQSSNYAEYCRCVGA